MGNNEQPGNKSIDIMEFMESVSQSLEKVVEELQQLRSVWEKALMLPREVAKEEGEE